MKEPYWLTLEECLALHDMMLAHYGGSPGLRDRGLLESALARPAQLLHYKKPELTALAGAYAAGIVKKRPFVDGNMRTGFMMAAGFLERNGAEFYADEADAVIRTLALAAGEMSEAKYSEWLKANTRRRKR
ncbi:MAG TPA: type II toxin-antitoxin system death-on-curing family toxin [Chthoniobacteraceae bacterium]|nr:type II toxin-antitoxin system death-on-curing family toxin [Chthoniobacteraceae bacterium]